ncbi:beta-glucanase [Kitasatospora aureofaciens]|uniref:beta-glucanase n=1 Tax=Kitasatospora aureofaciens TaxID=1894 RepID=UPI001C437E03|nr:beta-glucanase [Kitasatospora aureofaciens]MBV6696109.1 beta-glucanase [Kitasatospora aureofaciens]
MIPIINLWLATALMLSPLAAGAPAASDDWVETPYGWSRIAFTDRFQRLDVGPGRTWGWQTGAYRDDCRGNTHDFKSDYLTPTALSAADGRLTITARPAADGRWDTGLITTGDSCDTGGSGAEVRTGDLLLAQVRLPAANTGAWPALWTWRDGRNELDVFEWHADRPDTLEFVNQVHSGTGQYTSPDIAAGGWLWIGARFGAENTTWYVGTAPDALHPVYQDGTGVGEDFAAYVVLSLSVNNGVYHTAPTTDTPASLAAEEITVYRPAPPGLPDK